MDYDHFFRPVGLALDVVAPFQVRVALNDNEMGRQAPQGPVTTNVAETSHLQDTPESAERVLRHVWCLGYVPLPVVNYSLLWRRYGPTDVRNAIARTRQFFTYAINFLFRAFIYVSSVFFWLRFIISGIASCGNMVTFSESFFSDIFTFSLRNYPSLIKRRSELMTIAEYFSDRDTLSFVSFRQFVYDAAALKINASCVHVRGSFRCELTRSSLIFKLCDILEQCYPVWGYLPSSFLTAATVCIYVIYALGAQVLNINIVTFVSFITWKRQFPLLKCVFEMVKSVLTGAATSVL